MPRGRYSNLSVRVEVKKQLEELASKLGMTSPNDAVAYLLDKYREFTEVSVRLEKLLTDISVRLTDISVKQDKLLTDMSVKPEKQLGTEGSIESKQHATQSNKRTTAWDILKRDKVSCMSNIKAKNPARIIESLFEKGAVRIDLGRDVCVVYPEFWWRFWSTLENLKTPNDEENLKEIKDEKMKWLYTVLRREGIVVLDSTRKPPVWTFNKQVEIPEKAFEIRERGDISGSDKASPGEVEEHYEPVELYR
jgi:hypothetical protein